MKLGIRRVRSLFLACLVVVGGTLNLPSGSRPPRADVEQFLSDLRGAIDIEAPGSPPFQLDARFEAASFVANGKDRAGTLRLTWFGPGQWREEIASEGFTQLRVAAQGRLWTARNLPFEPLAIYDLERLIKFRNRLSLAQGETARETRKKDKGAEVLCAEITNKRGATREVCADAQRLSLLRIGPSDTTNPFETYEVYGEQALWANRQFPRQMRTFVGNKAAIQVVVEQLMPAVQQEPSLLTPPPDSTAQDWCDGAEPAAQLSMPSPEYSVAARQAHMQGVVAFYALVDTDGSLQHLKLVRSAAPSLDEAAFDSARKARYRPAMCGGKAIPSETIVNFSFWIPPGLEAP